MESTKKIRELRDSVGMTRKEFSEHVGIPVRTLEDWEAGRRTPPEYIPKLIAYQLKYEELVRKVSAPSVSHAQAMAKANEEYQKYQIQNFSPVEEQYLLAIKDIEKRARITRKKKNL